MIIWLTVTDFLFIRFMFWFLIIQLDTHTYVCKIMLLSLIQVILTLNGVSRCMKIIYMHLMCFIYYNAPTITKHNLQYSESVKHSASLKDCYIRTLKKELLKPVRVVSFQWASLGKTLTRHRYRIYETGWEWQGTRNELCLL